MTNWQTVLSGIATAGAGLAIIYFSVAMIPADAMDSSIRSVLVLAGVGMVTGGAGIAAARANATSVAAHQESLDKIAAAESVAKDDHAINREKIAALTVHVERVPEVVKEEVAQVREETVHVAKDVAKSVAEQVVQSGTSAGRRP